MTTTAPAPAPARRDTRFDGLRIVLGLLAVMWVVEVVDQVGDAGLDEYGIRPRATDGLDGIVFAPFLHGGFDHLASNTVPFLALGAVIAISGARRVMLVTLIVAAVGGIGVWLFAEEYSIHIGASGLVFGFAGYLVSRGVFERSVLHLAVGAVVVAVYGSALLSGLAPQDGISWQGHFFGAVGGVLAARLLAPDRSRPADARHPALREP